jgi:dihydrofolate reductase
MAGRRHVVHLRHQRHRRRSRAGPRGGRLRARMVNGGADVARHYLEAGVIQELRLHLVPEVLGAGTRLVAGGMPPNVRLRPATAMSSPLATHLTYEIEDSSARAH